MKFRSNPHSPAPLVEAKITVPIDTRIVATILFALLLSSCGGGSGSSGGGGGNGPSVSVVAPSSIVIGLPQAEVTVFGQGFTQQSQVLIDGQPASSTTYSSSSVLQANLSSSFSATAGTHQVSVQDGGQVSNSLPLTVYAMQPGPFVMQATPGFLVGENLSDPPFIVAADVNGDGLADVVMPGPVMNGGGSIAILLGRVAHPLIADATITVGAPLLRFLQGRVSRTQAASVLSPANSYATRSRNEMLVQPTFTCTAPASSRR